jgi:nucleotidyltransferase/DNA polymerase involved in DNA repair
MNRPDKKLKTIKDLQTLPNIGPAIAERLYSIGIKTAKQIKRLCPENIYEKLKKKEGGRLDKCVLYVLKGAKLNIPWWKCKDIREGKRG